MPPKTAKKKKKTGNNKTKKRKVESKQFKVDGNPFDKKTKLFAGRPARIRIKKDENAPFGVIKDDPEEWTDDANTAWDELESRGLLRYGVFSLKKFKKTKPKPKPKPKPKTKKKVEEKEEVELKDKNDTPDPDLISLSPDLEQSCEELIKTILSSSKKLTLESNKYQKLLKCVEEKNRKKILEDDLGTQSLYPNLDDPRFTEKISIKKEFNDVKIEKKSEEEIENIEEVANKLCNPTLDFELEPHQMFVRNFLSFQTPYNGLLLFHGLGTGKTCSSISVCEDMRTYYQQLGIKKKIMIVASPVVQENYYLQLFDPRKLKLINGLWNIKACTGNKFIKEVNPMNMKGLTRDKIIKQVQKIIRQSYEFVGYTEFANKINKLIKKNQGKANDDEKKLRRKISAIKKEFSNRLLVIDEVHNIRTISTKKTQIKRTTQNMLDLVRYAENMKLLLLTATPMFNNATEIIWLTNLLNLNDKRYPIEVNEVFDKNNNFLKNEEGNDIGKELLIQKLIGYVSYVSGENPFTFPSKIWPSDYKNPHSLKLLLDKKVDWSYPKYQINNMEIENPIKYLDLVITPLHEEQNKAYNYVIEKTKEAKPILNEKRLGIQYTVIDGPQQSLNMIYPNADIDKGNIDMKSLYGMTGLKRTMHFDRDTIKGFKYERKILDKFGRLFSSDGAENSPLKKYSAKIYSIMKSVKKSKGIVLIYSNYVAGGCIPIALALEELGFQRYGGREKSLFETPPKASIGNYVMITGDKRLSPSPKKDLKACTSENNINGENVKVIIISRAGSEGLDFKNIRQVHILEPWFNLNRADQIIGRAVRNKSHCALPFSERNVQVFLYGSQLSNPEIEPIDLYVYRLAEYKSIQIGKVSRVLKENAIDCLINKNQQDMLANNLNKSINLELSTGENINFKIGHKNYSLNCDFMTCEYTCNPINSIDKEITTDSYSQSYIIMNLEKILKRIKTLFREHYIYEKGELIKRINAIKTYSTEQINMALDVLINDKNEYIIDMLDRTGRLVNIGNFYLFQPIELDNKHIIRLEREKPIDVKRHTLEFILPEEIDFKERVIVKEVEDLQSLTELQKQFTDSITIHSKPKTWITSASWVIDSLLDHDKLNKKDLQKFCLEHLFDILNINEKLSIMNALRIKEQDSSLKRTAFKTLLKSITDKYIIPLGDKEGFVAADYKKQWAGKGTQLGIYMFFLDKEKNQWISDKQKVASLLPELLKKFMYKDISLFNEDLIGFLTHNKRKTGIVFKIKSLRPLEGKKQTGLECPSKGENMQHKISRVNGLLEKLGKKENKYKMKENSKNKREDTIYGKPYFQKNVNVEDNENIGITEMQVCVETELLLRYLDKRDGPDKKWFFSTVEDAINHIKDKTLK